MATTVANKNNNGRKATNSTTQSGAKILSRSKACKSCASMKRRCDMLFPSCSRCAKRGTPCVYSNTTSNPMALYMTGVTANTTTSSNTATSSVESPSSSSPSSLAPPPPPPALLYSSSSHGDTSPSENSNSPLNNNGAVVGMDTPSSRYGFPESLVDEVDTFVNSTAAANSCSLEISEDYAPSITATTNNHWGDIEGLESSLPCVIRTSSVTQSTGLRYFIFREDDPPTNMCSKLYRDREICEREVDFYISRVRQYHRIFLRTLETPFIHRLLYSGNLPESLKIAHSISALYESKNDVNERVIFNAIEDSVASLFKINYKQSPKDTLAFTQALLLVQCIRLFDNNIRQSSASEKLNHKLLSLLDDLIDYQLINYSECENWKGWIFSQSLCRTVTLGYFVVSLYDSLRLNRKVELIADIPISLPRAMWTARTDSEWKLARHRYSALCTTFVTAKNILDRVPSSDSLGFEALVLCSVLDGLDNIESKLNLSLARHPEYIAYKA